MSISGYNIKRGIQNLVGRLFMYEKCVFCGDRSNWKPWTNTFTEAKYDLPICDACFHDQPLDAVQQAINKDISEYNEMYWTFEGKLGYSDEEREKIMIAVIEEKNVAR